MATLRSRLPQRPFNLLLDQRRVIRWAIIAVLLVAVVMLSRRPSAAIVPLPIVAVVAWIFLRYPGLGPVAILVGGLAINFALGTGTQTSLHLAFLAVPMLGGLWVAKGLYQRSFRMVPSPANFPLIGLVVTAGVSLVAGNLAWNAFAQTAPVRTQIGALGVFAISAGAFLLVANEVKSVGWLKLLTWTFIGLGSVYIAGRLLPGGGFVTRLIHPDATGSLFWVWLVVMTFGQALFNRNLGVGWRLLCAIVGTATLVLAVLPPNRGWASGWLPALAGLGVLLWLRWPRLALLMGVVAVLVGLLNYNNIMAILLGDGNDYSLLTRGAATEIILGIARANPLLGLGPANYYYYTPLVPILGYYVRFNSHNQYVDLIAQVGVLGTLFFALFCLATWRLGWRLRTQVEDGFARAYVNACLAGLAASVGAGILGDWVLPFVYNVGIKGMRASLIGWLFLGGLVAINVMKDKLAPAPAAAPEAAAP